MNRVSETALIQTMSTISGVELETNGSDPLDQGFGEIGFDSLARQELMGRLERAHGVQFDSSIELTDESTPRELLATLDTSDGASA